MQEFYYVIEVLREGMIGKHFYCNFGITTDINLAKTFKTESKAEKVRKQILELGTGKEKLKIRKIKIIRQLVEDE